MKLPKPEQQPASSPEVSTQRFTRRDYLTPHVFVPSALVACFGIFLLWVMLPEGIYDYAPAFMKPTNPLREPVFSPKKTFTKGYAITPMRHYVVDARMLGMREYPPSEEIFSDISPFDMFWGWGPMANARVLDYVHFTFNTKDGGRFATPSIPTSWSSPDLSMNYQDVIAHSDNNHLIPASPVIEEKIRTAPVGSMIHVEGFLVDAESEDGIHITSSLTYGWKTSAETWIKHPYKITQACKVIYVTKFEVR